MHPTSLTPLETCACGLTLPAVGSGNQAGPTHRYMLSSPSCWQAYGKLLSREYEDPARWATHRYAVDAYAVQHPGVDTPQARNSVGVHLSRLCLLFERGWPLERANDAMLAITAKKFAYPWLTPPTRLAGATVADVLEAPDAEAHRSAVIRWAETAWVQWEEHHATVRSWLQRLP